MSSWPPRPPSTCLTVVVPLYNESHRFGLYATELGRFIARYPVGSELVFVDDGSRDGTAELVERFIVDHRHLPVRLMRRPHEGKGAAVGAALMTATSDLAGFCDLDLATPLDELARIVDAAARAPILAIGSRGATTSRITRHQRRSREALGKLYNRVVQLTVVPGIVDSQCGAKAANTEIWRRIIPPCREPRFAWDVELLAVARSLGVPVQEIGIEWRHQAGSRVHPLSDGARMVRAIPRIRRNLSTTLRNRADQPGVGGGAFDDENAATLASADTAHWWFRSKAAFVSLLIRRQAPTDGWLVDIGAGPGGVTAMLAWAPDRTLALEGNVKLVQETKRRHAVVPVACDAARLPVADATASVVCLLDVIEHLADPVPTIREAARILKDEGRLIVNVPAHPRLWSAADEVLGHARRYTRKTLRRDLELGGCEVLWISHVFSWLVVPVWIQRRALPPSDPPLGLDVRSPLLDRLSMLLTRLEWLLVSHVTLPFGTSVLCVAARADRRSG